MLKDRSGFPKLVGEKLRDFMDDGNYGGYYERSDKDMQAIWQIAVEETRMIIEKGWDV